MYFSPSQAHSSYGYCALLFLALLAPSRSLAKAQEQSRTVPDLALSAPPPDFYVKEIILLEAPYLNKREEGLLLAPYLERVVSVEDIQQLGKDIRAYYLTKGYPTFNVQVILSQDLSSGVLKLKVVQGLVEEIRMDQDDWRARAQIRSAFLWPEGRPLYLPHLEQGLDQMNTVFSSNARMTILPGTQPGTSIIQINNIIAHPWRLELGTDNLGPEHVGKLQGKANLGLDNLLALNDHLLLLYARSLNNDPASEAPSVAGKNHEAAQSRSARYSFILGNTQITGKYGLVKKIDVLPLLSLQSSSHLDKHAKTELAELCLEAKRLMLRFKEHQLHLTVSGTQKLKQVTTAGKRTDSGAQKFTILDPTLSYASPVGGGRLFLSLAGAYGWMWAGQPQKNQAKEINYSPAYPFQKINQQLAWSRLFGAFGQKLYYQIKASSQHSWGLAFTKEHAPIDQEYMSLSGLGVVRGLLQPLAAPAGLAMTHEVSFPQLLSLNRFTAPLHPFLGLDWAHSFSPLAGNRQNWLGWAAGFRYHAHGLSLDLTYARPLLQEDELLSGQDHKKPDRLFRYPLYGSMGFNLHELMEPLRKKVQAPQQ